jgi:hypothetical protein
MPRFTHHSGDIGYIHHFLKSLHWLDGACLGIWLDAQNVNARDGLILSQISFMCIGLMIYAPNAIVV